MSLTLYVKDHCPYSRLALKAVEALGADIVIKNKNDDGVIDEVIARGGKKQFPFLFNEETNEALYDSDAIVKKLCEKFGGDPSEYSEEIGDVCPVCND